MSSSDSEASIYESKPINKNQAFLKKLKSNKQIKGIFPVAYKPVLFQSEKVDSKITLASGKDSILTQQNIQGALIKGVDSSYDWDFFKKHLKQGKLPEFSSIEPNYDILISQKIAHDLNFKIGDTIRSFFVRSTPVMRFFRVVGIYETGLEEHDKKIAIGDLRIVQELNDWGINASLEISDTIYKVPIGYEDELIVQANATGGKGMMRFNWGEGYGKYTAKLYNGFRDTTFRVVVSDYYTNIDGRNENPSIADTAMLKITVKPNKVSKNDFKLNEFGELDKHYSDNTGLRYSIKTSDRELFFEHINGKGSHTNYIGGFEITVKNWENLAEIEAFVKKNVEFIPTEHQENLKVSSIKEIEGDIFVWLSFLDLNVAIILFLMILIGIINMSSALLVLILIRTNFIGILKSMGANNWTIRKIFLSQAFFLIIRGMIIGNIIGVGLCFLQSHFSLIPLNPEVYYLNTVPIDLSVWSWLVLNIGTLTVCFSAMIIPSIVITRISPVKAIKFN